MVGAVGDEWVFGYGSLVLALERLPSRERRPQGYVTELAGHRRRWGVAMDNRRDLPGYKHYLAADGTRPALWVAFLDVVPDPDGAVNGVAAPVAPAALPLLDARERNYDRVDVTDLLDSPPGRTWAYVGSAAGRARRAEGEAAGALAIQRDYLECVRQGFAALGEAELAQFEASTEPPPAPVLDLLRVDLPAEGLR
jgi:hypothetical protein